MSSGDEPLTPDTKDITPPPPGVQQKVEPYMVGADWEAELKAITDNRSN